MAEENLPLLISQIIIGVLGILGNSLVCVVIIKVYSMHTITNAFIFNQALIDFLGSIVLLLNSVIPIPDPLPPGAGGALLCRLWESGFLYWEFFISSTFNLVALTLERYLAIVFPFKYPQLATRRNIILTIACVWILAFLFALRPMIGLQNENGECMQVEIPYSEIFGIVLVIATYFLPFTVMLVVYVHITLVLKKGAARLGPAPAVQPSGSGSGVVNDQRGSLMRARRNTFKTLLIVFIAFTVCWTPHEVKYFLFSLGVIDDLTSPTSLITVAMIAANGCVNPFIYAIKYKQFRKALKKLFGRQNQVPENSLATLSANP
ncbi:alpha-1A adrenergic receptor-like [Asterias amurensis]|uniref:alpha-1A adrenergic receptor-like n=1 Tax=Asterias amurensis TaxID=7602 RepID=UPI003AB2E6F9